MIILTELVIKVVLCFQKKSMVEVGCSKSKTLILDSFLWWWWWCWWICRRLVRLDPTRRCGPVVVLVVVSAVVGIIHSSVGCTSWSWSFVLVSLECGTTPDCIGGCCWWSWSGDVENRRSLLSIPILVRRKGDTTVEVCQSRPLVVPSKVGLQRMVPVQPPIPMTTAGKRILLKKVWLKSPLYNDVTR